MGGREVTGLIEDTSSFRINHRGLRILSLKLEGEREEGESRQPTEWGKDGRSMYHRKLELGRDREGETERGRESMREREREGRKSDLCFLSQAMT